MPHSIFSEKHLLLQVDMQFLSTNNIFDWLYCIVWYPYVSAKIVILDFQVHSTLYYIQFNIQADKRIKPLTIFPVFGIGEILPRRAWRADNVRFGYVLTPKTGRGGGKGEDQSIANRRPWGYPAAEERSQYAF